MGIEDKKVVIYSTPSCHFCKDAKKFFKESGIAYDEYDVANDIDKRKEMVEKSNQMGVPVIVVNDIVVFVGFNAKTQKEIEDLLEIKKEETNG